MPSAKYQREWRKRNPDKVKAYRKKNQEKRKAYDRQYYLEHREERIVRTIKWVKENPEKVKIYRHKSYLIDKEFKRRFLHDDSSKKNIHLEREDCKEAVGA